MEKLQIPVQNLQQRMQNIQGNLSEIRDIMSLWAKQPLFERKDGKKDAVLCLDEKTDRIGKRYAEIKAVSEKIQTLLEENLKLFGLEGQKDSQMWQDYVKFVDGIIYNSLLVTVGIR